MMSWMRQDLVPGSRWPAATPSRTPRARSCRGPARGLGARRVRHAAACSPSSRGASRLTVPPHRAALLPDGSAVQLEVVGRTSLRNLYVQSRLLTPFERPRVGGRPAAGPRAAARSGPPGAAAPLDRPRTGGCWGRSSTSWPGCPTRRCRSRSPAIPRRPPWPPPCWPTRRRRRRWTSWPMPRVSGGGPSSAGSGTRQPCRRPTGGPGSASSRPSGSSPAGRPRPRAARAVGFATPSAFTHAFRRELGTTPSQFVRYRR